MSTFSRFLPFLKPYLSRMVLAGLLVRLGVESGPLAVIGSANLEFVGFMIVGLFIAAWLIALAVWRFGEVEKRWAPAVE